MIRTPKGYSRVGDNKFIARINIDGQYKYLGTYDNERDAINAYNKACDDRLVRSVGYYGHDIRDGVRYKEYYIVFDNGDIFSTEGRKLKFELNSKGYLRCPINGYRELVHRIVADCFLPNYCNKPCINHKNGLKTDNRVENLEWCTHEENSNHAHRNGLINYAYGERSANTSLTEDDIRYIRRHYIPRDIQYGMKALAVKFNVSVSTIYSITSNKRWNHIHLTESED